MGKANSSNLMYEATAQVRTQLVGVSVLQSLLSSNTTIKKRWFKKTKSLTSYSFKHEAESGLEFKAGLSSYKTAGEDGKHPADFTGPA